jgi:hypothetical protein
VQLPSKLGDKSQINIFHFLKPRPPIAFGRNKESQDLRKRFLDFVGGKPHQKFLKD